ncbi:MAG: hypothetical protein IID34_04975 [Planctomycetes bacterium]|nr:hypothetical protein [Planctomycetota bacterium]
MPHEIDLKAVNTNPLAFEELAMSLASLTAYFRDGEGDMADPIRDFEKRFTQAMQQPASYTEITELTGQSLSAGDRCAGRGAWLLMNIENLAVCAVHSLLWHNKSGRYSIPLLDQMAAVLGIPSQLDEDDLQMLGRKASIVDVVGLKEGVIWLVQTLSERRLAESAVRGRVHHGERLFRGSVFENVVLGGPQLQTLYNAYDVMRKAFLDVPVVAMALVLHPDSPDFELYGIEVKRIRSERFELIEKMIKRNSLDYEDDLTADHESLWTLSHRFDSELFVGLPPCRGGRTLAMLASAATRQQKASELLPWKERDFSKMLKSDFGYDVPRDKVRHDLVDRLVGQGFMRKWGSEYSLTVKGIARYEYCLAKYTTKGASDPLDVLDACIAQRDKIIGHYGCL